MPDICDHSGGCANDPHHDVPDGVPVYKLYDLSGEAVLGWFCRIHAQARVLELGKALRRQREARRAASSEPSTEAVEHD